MDSNAERENDLGTLASLAEPVRRAFYGFVAASSDSVSRDQAAEAVGVSRQVAAYHLDRLADDGLLDVEFRRLTGRVGPGAGRPSKLYRRSEETFDVTIPPRRYELAARILLDAVGEGDLGSDVIAEVARRTGRELGIDGLDRALATTGFEATVEDGETRFRNCPFHVLRDQDRDTTCAMNQALVEGMIEGSGADFVARLAPEDGYCCVRLSPDPAV